MLPDDMENNEEKTVMTMTLAPAATVHLLPQTVQLRALHTVVRDRTSSRTDFVVCADRIIRLVVETGLGLLPHERHVVRTPVGAEYEGLRAATDVVAVPIVRAGESMESGVRALRPGIRVGKILIQRDRTTKQPRLHCAWLPPGIAEGHVLLLDPMLATGGTAVAALEALADEGVPPEHVVFVSLIAVADGIEAVHRRFPQVPIVTSAIEQRLDTDAYMVPGMGDFGDRYFGTDAPRSWS